MEMNMFSLAMDIITIKAYTIALRNIIKIGGFIQNDRKRGFG